MDTRLGNDAIGNGDALRSTQTGFWVRLGIPLVSAAVAVGLHLAWFRGAVGTWSAPAGPSARAVAPPLRYLSEAPLTSREAWHRELRGVWSPLVFALPTPVGFSRSRQDFFPALIPGDAPPPAPLWLAADTSTPPAATAFPSASLGAMVSSLSPLPPPPVEERAAPGETEKRTEMLYVTWRGSDGRDMTRLWPLPGPGPWTDDQPWEATAFVYVSAEGTVDDVILEKPTKAPDRNAALLRMLKTSRLDRSVAEGTGRLLLRYEPRPAEAPVAP